MKERLETSRFSPSPEKGLNEHQVQEHLLHGWKNNAVKSPSKSIKEIVKSNVFTYFNLIFAIIAILLILVGSFRNLTFLPVIIGNTLIGIIQEIRSKRTLDKLTMLNAPRASVVRSGKILEIDAEELVLDDIVIFRAGNQICADAIVVSGEVQVNESLLTGESDEITKKNGDTLMSGSFIVSGECRARLEKVGEDSYISKLTLQAKQVKEGEQSEMLRSLELLVKVAGILILPVGILLFSQQFFFSENSLRESVTSMVAAVIGMIPEGLYLLASVALVVSVMRLAKKKVLAHDMKCIETLARVNVLCVDKTGTITENTMKVIRTIPTSCYDSKRMPPLQQTISDFAAAMSADNITMEAIKEYFSDISGREPLSHTSFSSATKYSSVTFSDAVYVLGAPEFVLRGDYISYQNEIETYSREGYRVLVFASYHGTIDGKALTAKAVPLAWILLANPVRPSAWETFQYFAEQGVDIKVISGDNPQTVSEVARQAGIRGADRYLDAGTLHTQEELEAAVCNYTVFGRVTPEQKRQFVHALKKAGKTVAMTGDGVNDVLALKDADCSIAMASGSDAAAHAAQLVLLDSNFSCMPEVVAEGRRVVNNIQRSASLFLVKNIFSFLLAIFSLVSMVTYPLEPSQVSLISMFTIGMPGFLLALQPNKNIIQGQFLPNVLLRALPGGLTDVLMVGTLVVFGQEFGVDPVDISTAATLLLAIVGFMILFRNCQPFNRLRTLTFVGSMLGLLFCSIFMSDLFALTTMSKKCIMLLVVFSVATEPVLRYLLLATANLQKLHKKLQKKKQERKRRKAR